MSRPDPPYWRDRPAPSDLERFGAERYVSLTTFHPDGTPVATPVWVVRDGDRLLVWTGAGTGTVRRLAHTSRVTLTASDFRGRPRRARPFDPTDPVASARTASPVEGTALVRDGRDDRARILLAGKYGLVFRATMGANIVLRLLRRRPPPPMVVVEITPAGA
jgi:uncharacterized protein